MIDRLRDPMRALAIVESAIGLSALVMVPMIGWMPIWLTQLLAGQRDSFTAMLVWEFGIVLLIMLVPTTLMGAAFPLANRLAVAVTRGIGRTVGTVYSVNSLGAIIGSFCAGFVLIPWLGIPGAIFVAVLVNVAAGGLFSLMTDSLTPIGRRGTALALGAAAVASVAMLPGWDPAAMSSGPFYAALRLPEQMLASKEKMA